MAGRAFLLILASLAIGIATLIAWDGLAQNDGWAVTSVGETAPLFSVVGTTTSTYKVAQHSSAVAGVLVIAQSLARWH